MKNIGIIGGGIIGLASAYYLQKAGHKVTIFDRDDLFNSCSVGNAGMIVPSHIIPLAAPGMVRKGLRWMFNSSSPFYIKPRVNTHLLKWGLQFYRHATHTHVERSIPVLKAISLLSKALYQEMVRENPFHFGYEERGLLMLYQTKETETEEVETAHVANKHGVEAHILTISEIQKLEPHMKVTARGGIYFPGDAHLVPHQLVKNLISYLMAKGVNICSNTPVYDFQVEEGRILFLKTFRNEISFDHYVLAAGAWSATVSLRLQLRMLLQGGKGYSFTLDEVEKNIRIPSILLEGRVAATPMGSSLRFGGTMEINGTDLSTNMKRVKGIVDTIPAYYPELNISLPLQSQVWCGLRPCSPDGLPYIGQSSQFKNLIIATGHSMMGLSLAPATGKLVCDLINEESTSIPVQAFDPERFS